MPTAYKKLCTEFYNLTKPQAPEKEVQFYTEQLKDFSGPFLEAMCGSGRLLIPLLNQGFDIEGVDNSPDMLASCKERCASQGLKLIMYQQSLEELSLPKKYNAIIIAVGSFQLITDKQEVFKILYLLRNHLNDGGMLLLDTFVPDFDIPDNEIITRITPISDRHLIRLTSQQTLNTKESLYHADSLYEKIESGVVTEVEHEQLTIRWYKPDELIALLHQAGFKQAVKEKQSFEPGITIDFYKATA